MIVMETEHVMMGYVIVKMDIMERFIDFILNLNSFVNCKNAWMVVIKKEYVINNWNVSVLKVIKVKYLFIDRRWL